MPVLADGAKAMLKLAYEPEERRGAAVMVWWAGEGAARVLRHEGEGLLMERASGGDVVAISARDDDAATRILCQAAARLHGSRRSEPAGDILVPLETWFAALGPAAARHGGVLAQAHAIAVDLLAAPEDICVLHGDLHHGNVLDFGPRGWLAIDPKGLLGERGFDFANIFCNPDPQVASPPERLRRQVRIVSEAAGLEPRRLLQWIAAYAGLSASWTMEGQGDDLGEADAALTIARIACAELAS